MFSPNSFNRVSFSPKSFYGSQGTTEEARSGYWRLFFYQLQEKELAKREAFPTAPEDKPEPKPKPKFKSKPPVRVKLKPVVPNPLHPTLKPLYRPLSNHKVKVPTFILTLQLMSEIHGLYAPIRGRMETPVQAQSDRKLRLLLLLGG